MIPPWVDRREYPFEPRGLDVAGARLSYVDEGRGSPIVMVHGTPTWSFLYRHLIRELSPRYRCVAPDHLGFGLSDRPAGWSYRPEDQAGNLARLIETLGLKDITLVVHDYGGPIGLAYALDHPENVRRLVLFNTWMWSFAGDRRVAWAARALGGRLGRYLYEQRGFAVRVMLRRAVADRRRYSPEVERHYLLPLDGHATWIYARELLGSSAWYDRLWARRDRIARMPTILIWGMKDPAFARYLQRWQGVFEQAEVVQLADCGHAPPEERAPESLPFLIRFLER
ncbi:MAG: alpha/beta fold hydrolase [Candidatus Rokuibacteriota bacterium]